VHNNQPAATVYLKPAPQILDMSQELLYAKAEILKQRALIKDLQAMVSSFATTVQGLQTSLSTLSNALHAVARSGSYNDLKDKPVRQQIHHLRYFLFFQNRLHRPHRPQSFEM
jgi:hypothetical protein